MIGIGGRATYIDADVDLVVLYTSLVPASLLNGIFRPDAADYLDGVARRHSEVLIFF